MSTYNPAECPNSSICKLIRNGQSSNDRVRGYNFIQRFREAIISHRDIITLCSDAEEICSMNPEFWEGLRQRRKITFAQYRRLMETWEEVQRSRTT